MKEFEEYLKDNAGASAAIVSAIGAKATTIKLRKNDLLLQSGDICRHKAFVVKGLLRTFSVNAAGNEATFQFSPELNWTLDVESYDNHTPALVNIAAVEPSLVMLWEKKDFQSLLEQYPQLRTLSQQLISRNIYNSRQRIITALSATPEEKYRDFLEKFPQLIARLPLRMIASYLGISLKTLTRIRQAQLLR